MFSLVSQASMPCGHFNVLHKGLRSCAGRLLLWRDSSILKKPAVRERKAMLTFSRVAWVMCMRAMIARQVQKTYRARLICNSVVSECRQKIPTREMHD